MRFLAIFPALCAFVALILSFLCIFAGSKPGYMETQDIVTLNTSRIAVDIFRNNAQQPNGSGNGGSSSIIGDVTHQIAHDWHHLTQTAEHDIESALNNALASFAATIGLHDFYSVHVLDFCEGFFTPNASSPHRNVTQCSSTTALFAFHPGRILQRELAAAGVHISLADLHWPSAIDEAIASLALAFNVMFVLYCLATGAAGLAVWTSAAGVFFTGRAAMLVNLFLTQLAFCALLIASAIVTGAATKATDVVNQYGKAIDVNATRGDKLIALSWTAMLLMFLAGVYWMIEFCALRRKEKKMPKELQ